MRGLASARRTFLAVGLAALVALVSGPAGATKETTTKTAPRLRVDFIDVGQGDAALITSPTGKTVLIDGGPVASSAALVTFLRGRLRGPLDLIVLTHRHADHFGGLRAVVEQVGTRMFMDAPTPHPGRERERLLAALERARVPVRDATRGRVIELGPGVTLRLLGPADPPITDSDSRDEVNANSVVARLDYGRSSFLFTGDAEAATERRLLQERANVSAQVLKVAHHGSRYSSTARFLAAVHPTTAVISVGARNDYKHPTPATLQRLEKAGVRILRTDLDGTITMETDGTTISTSSTTAPARAGQDRLKELSAR
jgi:beta-lactamase superfamily II metal-dependent hydrolase